MDKDVVVEGRRAKRKEQESGTGRAGRMHPCKRIVLLLRGSCCLYSSNSSKSKSSRVPHLPARVLISIHLSASRHPSPQRVVCDDQSKTCESRMHVQSTAVHSPSINSSSANFCHPSLASPLRRNHPGRPPARAFCTAASIVPCFGLEANGSTFFLATILGRPSADPFSASVLHHQRAGCRLLTGPRGSQYANPQRPRQ